MTWRETEGQTMADVTIGDVADLQQKLAKALDDRDNAHGEAKASREAEARAKQACASLSAAVDAALGAVSPYPIARMEALARIAAQHHEIVAREKQAPIFLTMIERATIAPVDACDGVQRQSGHAAALLVPRARLDENIRLRVSAEERTREVTAQAIALAKERDELRDALVEAGRKMGEPLAEAHRLRAENERLRERAEGLEKERDAYRKAKAENDERFMIERDEARAERDALRKRLEKDNREGLDLDAFIGHTPGTWEVGHTPGRSPPFVFAPRVDGQGREHITDSVWSEVDALLIAAAPALLAELRRVPPKGAWDRLRENLREASEALAAYRQTTIPALTKELTAVRGEVDDACLALRHHLPEAPEDADLACFASMAGLALEGAAEVAALLDEVIKDRDAMRSAIEEAAKVFDGYAEHHECGENNKNKEGWEARQVGEMGEAEDLFRVAKECRTKANANREHAARLRAALGASTIITRQQRQQRVAEWCRACFGEAEATHLGQRGLRLLEEAAEATQACGIGREQAGQVLDVVFSRPVGEIAQELGGVGVTALALAAAAGVDADQCERAEVDRILAKDPEHFRKRNAEKNALGLVAVKS